MDSIVSSVSRVYFMVSYRFLCLACLLIPWTLSFPLSQVPTPWSLVVSCPTCLLHGLYCFLCLPCLLHGLVSLPLFHVPTQWRAWARPLNHVPTPWSRPFPLSHGPSPLSRSRPLIQGPTPYCRSRSLNHELTPYSRAELLFHVYHGMRINRQGICSLTYILHVTLSSFCLPFIPELPASLFWEVFHISGQTLSHCSTQFASFFASGRSSCLFLLFTVYCFISFFIFPRQEYFSATA